MESSRPTYEIRLADARLSLWDDAGGGIFSRPILTNSFGGQAMMTVAASEYKGAQQEKDKGGGYVLVRLIVK